MDPEIMDEEDHSPDQNRPDQPGAFSRCSIIDIPKDPASAKIYSEMAVESVLGYELFLIFAVVFITSDHWHSSPKSSIL
jgi:hypothetical protein